MKVYTYSQARQQLASLLDQVVREGSVRIRRRDGTLFRVEQVRGGKSGLDVPGVDAGVTAEEFVAVVREGRARTGRAQATPKRAGSRKRRTR
jgi:hypothetical protein